jgi:hypothetical protein
MAIKAGERIVFGNSFERDGLIEFIDQCYDAWQNKTEHLSWFEFI